MARPALWLTFAAFALVFTGCLSSGTNTGTTSDTASVDTAVADTGSRDVGAASDVPVEPDTLGPDAAPDVGPDPDTEPDTETDPGGADAGPMCCGGEGDCAFDEVCRQGACMPVPPASRCWEDGDCDCGWTICDSEPTSRCSGGTVCPCGDPCPIGGTLGMCVPYGVEGACCANQDDCYPGTTCLIDDAANGGVCVPPASAPGCWSAADCDADGATCTGVALGSCGGAVPAQQGVCQSAGVCCGSDADCPLDASGVAPVCREGVCVPAPSGGQCWGDGDCDCGWEDCASIPSSYCVGAHVCGCGEACTFETDSPGTCSPLGGYGMCCTQDAHCEGNLVCGLPASGGFLPPEEYPGICVPPAGPGECYTDSHCAAGLVCFDAAATSCFQGAFYHDPGTCIAEAGLGACCNADLPCGVGLQCAQEVCKPPATFGGCWSDLDCEPQQACKGAEICGCDADCANADKAGICDGPYWGCCTANGGCPLGEVCASTSGPDTCAPTYPGACYRDTDCGPDEICDGAFVCPCNADCDAEESGGSCRSCAVYDGSCDDMVPAQPWWYWDGDSCKMEATCSCEGCPGTFVTLGGCEAACQ